MNVTAVYINTHRYDYKFTRICVASVRYWYPDIDIFLIEDNGRGSCKTGILQKKWNVKVFATAKKTFGWGYGKLELLFSDVKHSFLVLDSDTVLTGAVLKPAENCDADFLVDDEIQPTSMFNKIYYNLEKINQIDPSFKYPGYSFNSGQWFGTSSVLTRKDFETGIDWTEPPKSKYPGIIFNGDQSILNFIIHRNEALGKIKVARKKLMIWPDGDNAGFISLNDIKDKKPGSPFIIHWAGMKSNTISRLKRADILDFYLSVYNTRLSFTEKVREWMYISYLPFEKWLKAKF